MKGLICLISSFDSLDGDTSYRWGVLFFNSEILCMGDTPVFFFRVLQPTLEYKM